MLENPIAIRPLRLVELLDAAFRLYRRNFLTFVGIMALMQIPISLLSLGASLIMMQGVGALQNGRNLSSQYFLGLGGTMLVGLLSFFLVRGLATAALTRTVAASYLGRQLGVFESYRKMGPSAGNLLASLLLVMLISFGMGIWLLIPCVGWLSGLGILYYFSFVIIQLLVPVVVLEKRSPMDAIRRAWELARRRFWWLLGLVGVLFLLNLVLIGPAALFNYVLQLVMQGTIKTTASIVTSGNIGAVITALMGMLVGLLYYPLQFSVIVLAYFDLRVRSEGFDLAMQSITSAEYPDPVDGIAAAPAAPRQNSLVTGMELGYFVAFTLGATLVLVLAYSSLVAIIVGISSFFSTH